MRIATRLFLAAGLLALVASVRAGTIPNGTYTGSGTGGTATASVANNFLGTGINLVTNAKNFRVEGYIDISFPIVNSGGTVSYAVTEGVSNSTSELINPFEVMLGTGTGAGFAENAPAGYMFSSPTSSNYGAGALSSGNQTITYSGGTGIPPGGTATFGFLISVPDSDLSHFTLREVASFVPEPSSSVLAFLGGAGVIVVLVWRQVRMGRAMSC
jgi:hypothetical protein